MSKITPRFFAASAAGSSLPSWTMLVPSPAMLGAPEKQCVRMSPGRSRSRICDISARSATPPMWHITLAGTPDISHAWTARLSGSVPFLAITFSLIRTLTPSTMSAFSATVRAAASGCAYSML